MYRLLLFIVAISGQSTKAVTREKKNAANCLAVHEQQLDSSRCTSHMQLSDSDFVDLRTLLTDAQRLSNSVSFISYVLDTSYQYIHCASRLEAVTALYFRVPARSLPPPSSAWWSIATRYLSSHTLASNSPEDHALLRHKLANIARASSPACVQWLIENFQDNATAWWRNAYPNFPDPNPYTSTTSTSTTARTTTTTTTLPTTTSTPKPTTLLPTTATTQAKSTNVGTTTKIPTHVSSGVSCTVCQDLDCLLAPQVRKCPPHHDFCLITVTDSGRSRSIARGCADKAKCDSIHQKALCAQVETGYHSGAVCEFCCSADNCNSPPALVPPQSTRYPQH